mgnify:CR=1 FL=1
MKHWLRLLAEVIGDALIVVFGVISLRFWFIPIVITGEVTLYEPNTVILYLEVGLAGGIALFGLERLVKDLWAWLKRRRGHKQ